MLIGCTMKLKGDIEPEFKIPYKDKILHFGIFAILGCLITYEKNNADYKTLILCTLYGIMIEIIQIFLPWRGFEIADMVCDSVGALAGIIVAKRYLKRLEK